MSTGDGHVTLLDTLDAKIADGVERAVRADGIPVRRSRLMMPVGDDPRLRQQGVRLEVGPADAARAKEVADELMMRRARLLTFPRARRGEEPALGGDSGITSVDFGGSDDGGDGSGGGDRRRTSARKVETMATINVPRNVGKVRVAMGLGGKYMVWNGKQDKHEFSIVCRNRKQAEELAKLINRKDRPPEVNVQG